MHVSMNVCTGVRSGAGKAYGRVTLPRFRLAEESFARGGGALPLSKVRRGERLELAFPLTGLGARQCARAAVHSEDRRGEGTLARVGVPQQSWVDPVLLEAAAATRSLSTPANCESERAPTRKCERTEGLEDGPIGCGAPGVGCPPGVCAPGVPQGP